MPMDENNTFAKRRIFFVWGAAEQNAAQPRCDVGFLGSRVGYLFELFAVMFPVTSQSRGLALV